jgi:hypothetical protein
MTSKPVPSITKDCGSGTLSVRQSLAIAHVLLCDGAHPTTLIE